jgi:hypothetical protein
MVFPKIPQKRGFLKVRSGISEMNSITISRYIFSSYKFEDIGCKKIPQ